jgi:3-oxoacyl-[acyl-carrier-protein] synthase II
MNHRKVVITGIGAITPIGNNIKEYWDGLYNGKNGTNIITKFDTFDYKTKFACELKNYDSDIFFNKKELKRLDLFSQYAMISSDEAINDSKLNFQKENLEKIGVIWGTGIGGLKSFEKELSFTKTSKFSPFFIPKIISDIAASHISIKYGLIGPNFSTISSCASSTNAIINSFYLIKFGLVDIVIYGG